MQVIRLMPREAAFIDPDVSMRLASKRGLDQAEAIVQGALTELGRTLRRLEDDYKTGDITNLADRTRAVITLADQIGMRNVARVAADVVRCCHGQDAHALSATLARLMRLMTRTLDMVRLREHPF